VDGVQIGDHDGVRVVSLDRPQQRNALDLQLRVVVAEELEKAAADKSVRAIVLTGTGGVFCAGGDTSTMRRLPDAESRPRLEAAQRVVRAIFDAPKPVLAAVEGYAVGLGFGLALACDRVVAARDARFLTGFTRIGLAADGGLFWSLPRRVGPARARQFLLMGVDVRGSAALDIGLIDAVTEPGEALDAALRDARLLAAGPPLAMAEIKTLLADIPNDPASVLTAEIETQVRMFDTADFDEGVAALREKRAPRFQGR
jgi:enoyl-CoA hydratase/carnithine racemase